jgi:hypothetical protein
VLAPPDGRVASLRGGVLMLQPIRPDVPEDSAAAETDRQASIREALRGTAEPSPRPRLAPPARTLPRRDLRMLAASVARLDIVGGAPPGGPTGQPPSERKSERWSMHRAGRGGYALGAASDTDQLLIRQLHGRRLCTLLAA